MKACTGTYPALTKLAACNPNVFKGFATVNSPQTVARHPMLVWTTVNSAEAATKLAEQLVTDRLAACVQIDGPVSSFYRWQGGVESSREWRLMMKTDAACYDALETSLRDRHPYELPEIVSVSVDRGLPEYLQWLADNIDAGAD